MIVSLDLGSTTTGWAVGNEMGIADSGYWLLKLSRFDDYGARALRLQNALTTLAMRYPIRECVFEAIEFQGKKSSVNEPQLYGLIYGAMALWCKNRLVVFYGVEPNVWKKAVIGKGNASKADILAAMRFLYKPAIDVQDEADAIAILKWRLLNPRSF